MVFSCALSAVHGLASHSVAQSSLSIAVKHKDLEMLIAVCIETVLRLLRETIKATTNPMQRPIDSLHAKFVAMRKEKLTNIMEPVFVFVLDAQEAKRLIIGVAT